MRLPECSDVFADTFRLDEKLGEGGFGVVFLARDAAGMAVALKVIKPDGADYHPDTVRRFERETAILAQLDNPHIVTLRESGRSPEGLLYMVSDFVSGTDLRDVLNAEGPQDLELVLTVLEQALTGLVPAHARGLCHRDIKPENIRIGRTDGAIRLTLLDFGIARPVEAGAAKITRTGVHVGTPRYMSPEVVANGPLTPAADVFSLGIVALEMLVGPAALPAVCSPDAVERALGQLGHLPVSFRTFLRKMVAAAPSKRFRDANAALRRLHALRDADARTTRLRRRLPQQAHQPTGPRRSKAPMVAAATCVLALAAWWVARGRADDRRPARVPQGAAQALLTPPAPASAPAATPTKVVATDGCGSTTNYPDLRREALVRGLSKHEWVVSLPSSYEPSVRHPLLFLLHQARSDGKEILAESGFEQIADEQGIVLVALDNRDEPAWEGPDVVDVVTEVFERTRRTHCIDPERVFLAGHGHGGGAALRLSCLSWVRGVASAATLPRRGFTFGCETALPALHILPLGTDHIVEAGGTGCGGRPTVSHAEYESLWRARNRTSAEPAPFVERADGACSLREGDAPFVSCRVAGGFGWPGTAPRLPNRDIFGCDGVSGTFPWARTMWQFFEALSAPAP